MKTPDPRLTSRTFCHKLECTEEFLKSYASGKAARGDCYLELFARFEKYRCKETGAVLPGLTSRVLKIKPGFRRYIFATLDKHATDSLPEKEVFVITGNILHDSTQRQVFDQIPRSSSILCVIEPPGYRRLRWSTMRKIITGGTSWQGYRMDMLMILPLENALFKNMNRPDCANSINRFFGSDKWQGIAKGLAESRISPLQARMKMVEMYIGNLKEEGYRHVEIFSPAKPGRIPAYLVIWASDLGSRIRQIKSIWQTPRFLPGEMFHKPS
jgi:three-Cys-motif partner protein